MSPRWMVFLSHSSSDKPTARLIRSALEKSGLDVWLDEAQIWVGDSIPGAIAQGLERSEALVLLVSKDSASSNWVEREFNAYISRAMTLGLPVLPCRLDETPMPTLIADLRYADFRRSTDEGIDQLLAARHLAVEAQKNIAAEHALDELLSSTRGEALDWSHAILKMGHYFVADHREDAAPYDLLGHLGSLDLLSRDADRYEVLWDITDTGKRVLALLDKQRTIPPVVTERVRRLMTGALST